MLLETAAEYVAIFDRLGAIRALALEGGGIKGIGEVGALFYLDQVGGLERLEEVVGTSAGALLALAIALGFSYERIVELLLETDFGEWLPGKWRIVSRLGRFLTTWGAFSSKLPRRWIEDRLEEADLPRTATFADVYARTGKKLGVATTDMDACEATLFSTWGSPRARVADAVLASMSIQGVFPPVVIDGHRHNDGGLTWNHPIDILPDRGYELEEILGVRVDSPHEISEEVRKVRGPFGLLLRAVSISMAVANRSHIAEDLWRRIVRVSTKVSGGKFSLSEAEKRELLESGRSAAFAWIKQTDEAT